MKRSRRPLAAAADVSSLAGPVRQSGSRWLLEERPTPTTDTLVRYNTGYAGNMRTAVSVPDDLFRQAEVAARRLRVSRSQLYATAISEFLDRQQRNSVTERLNEVYSRLPAKVDPPWHRAQVKSLHQDSW